jgi:hypothetical protein
MPVVAGEQVFDESGEAVLSLAVEVGVFEEIQIAGTADSSYLLEYAEGVKTQFFEFFAGGRWKHGRNYINLRTRYNGTLVLRAVEIRSIYWPRHPFVSTRCIPLKYGGTKRRHRWTPV